VFVPGEKDRENLRESCWLAFGGCDKEVDKELNASGESKQG